MKATHDYAKWLRLLLGVFLIGYAANQFLHYIPSTYGDMPQSAEDFLDTTAPYLPYLYIFEFIIGVFLLLDKWTSFIYILLFPLTFSFIMFTIINKDLGDMWPALVVGTLNIILLFSKKETYKVLFH